MRLSYVCNEIKPVWNSDSTCQAQSQRDTCQTRCKYALRAGRGQGTGQRSLDDVGLHFLQFVEVIEGDLIIFVGVELLDGLLDQTLAQTMLLEHLQAKEATHTYNRPGREQQWCPPP